MDTHSLISILTAGGFGLRRDGERLIVHPADGLTDSLRAMIREHKRALVAFLRSHDQAANDDDTRRRWLIHYPDGKILDVTCTPTATREELLRGHPEVLSAEPYEATPTHPKAPLIACDEARIRAWMAHTGEEDEAAIAEILESCRNDAEARDYFLSRASEAFPLPTTEQ